MFSVFLIKLDPFPHKIVEELPELVVIYQQSRFQPIRGIPRLKFQSSSIFVYSDHTYSRNPNTAKKKKNDVSLNDS